jgi:hypothetical protein
MLVERDGPFNSRPSTMICPVPGISEPAIFAEARFCHSRTSPAGRRFTGHAGDRNAAQRLHVAGAAVIDLAHADVRMQGCRDGARSSQKNNRSLFIGNQDISQPCPYRRVNDRNLLQAAGRKNARANFCQAAQR